MEASFPSIALDVGDQEMFTLAPGDMVFTANVLPSHATTRAARAQKKGAEQAEVVKNKIEITGKLIRREANACSGEQ